jgi:hypothetical protein
LARRLQSLVPENAPRSERLGFCQRVVGIYAFLIIANLSVWVWAFTAFAHQPVLIGTAVLAYSAQRMALANPSFKIDLTERDASAHFAGYDFPEGRSIELRRLIDRRSRTGAGNFLADDRSDGHITTSRSQRAAKLGLADGVDQI